MLIESIAIKPIEDGYTPLELSTKSGSIECRYYAARHSTRATLMVGGAGGGWDTPACGLYPWLCAELACSGVSALRVRFRSPEALEEAVLDLLTVITYLESEGISEVALVGHSFGAAVAIQTAAAHSSVKTVVALATQSFGAEPVTELSPRCSILLLHGDADPVLPLYCSEWAYFVAGDPKRLVVYEGAGHSLDEVAGPVRRVVREWILERLGADG